MLRQRRIVNSERGDTIIEVLLAIAVFSMVAVGAITLMNQGTQSAQKALEITLVRHQIDAQAEALRYVQDKAVNGTDEKYEAIWKRMTNVAPAGYAVLSNKITKLSVNTDGSCPARPANAFVMDAHNASAETTVFNDAGAANEAPFAHVYYDADSQIVGATGIWIEAAKQSASASFVDFAIKTCWVAPGSGPATVLGTIVRLYAP